MKCSPLRLAIILLAGAFSWVIPAAAGETVQIDKMLISGPLPVFQELFSDSLDAGDILTADYVNRRVFHPGPGYEKAWFFGRKLVMKTSNNGFDKQLKLHKNEPPEVIYGCFYVDNPQQQEITFDISCFLPCALFVDGKETARKMEFGENTSSLNVSSTLKRGKHTVLIKMVRGMDYFPGKSPTAKLEYAFAPRITVDPKRELSRYDDIRFLDSIADLAVSPNGAFGAAVIRSKGNGYDPKRTFIQIWDLKTKTSENIIADGTSTQFPVFSPDSKNLLYMSSSKDGQSIWIQNLSSGRRTLVTAAGKQIRAVKFGPGGERLYFLGSCNSGDEEKTYAKYEELRDKLTDWNENLCLYELSLSTGAKRRLTAPENYTISAYALSKTGSKIAYSCMMPVGRRPFFKTEIWIQDACTGKAEKAWEIVTGFENAPLNLVFSPNGKRLAFTSAPDSVGGNAEAEHNVYNSDLFVMNLLSGSVEKLTDDFKPSVVERAERSSISWDSKGEWIYFLAVDRSKRKIFKIDSKKRKGNNRRDIQEIKGGDVNTEFFSNLSRSDTFLSSASSFFAPSSIYLHDTVIKKTEKLYNPNREFINNTIFGSVERFDFTNSSGNIIDGWVLKPSKFDGSKKYPLIVYYYGGVAPRLEKFTFPYHWLNANGYVVYVLNPSGAYGAGDEFADLHLGDWGTLASADIIEGVTRLIESRQFIDSSAIGAYGGSYGGFITLDLVSKTSLFAAVCSMFGISNLSSYWGGGTWGFTYGDMAMAGSYPWEDRDLFVGKSPLYNAKKIRTPVLLLHGKSDINVPIEESRQIFTALKILGREAVLVEFAGEDHGIAGTTENLIAHREIMLEWFDKYLKGEENAWNDRWKE